MLIDNLLSLSFISNKLKTIKMTLTNAIKKAEKVTGQRATINGQFYTFNYLGSTVSFARNGRSDEATNYYTKRIGAKDDIMTDYFAGTFHDNLSQAFNFLNKYI